MPGRSFSTPGYRYGFNTQEKDDEITGISGSHNTAMFWEYDTRLGRRWNLDPKPSVGISDFACFMNSPNLNIDPLGDQVGIVHRKGFLGLGKKETVIYDKGSLFNQDGSAYTGKIKGFLKQAVKALNDLSSSREGANAVDELVTSKNVFTIKRGFETQFQPNDAARAGANLQETQAIGIPASSGSGGTIFFNPHSKLTGTDVKGNTTVYPFVSLGHEFFHARDANRGQLFPKADFISLNKGVYFGTYLNLYKAEWRAVYYENIVRSQLGMSLRQYYGLQYDSSIPGNYKPTGPNLLDAGMNPVNYPAYSRLLFPW